MPAFAAAFVWLSRLWLWGVPPAAFDDDERWSRPTLEIRSVRGSIVRVSGDHFPVDEVIWLSINEDRGGRYTDCRGDEVTVHPDWHGRLSARLRIPSCARHLCKAHTETLGATAQYRCGLDCDQTDVNVFACPAR